MVTRKTCAKTGYDRRRRINRVSSEHTAVTAHLFRLAIATLIAALVLAPAWGDTDGCTVENGVATCEDVPTDGIQADFDGTGITEIRVGDGVQGETGVAAGQEGIELTRSGSAGANADPEAEFGTIPYDTDNDSSTADVSVVSGDGENPYLVDGSYIVSDDGDPPTYTIGEDSYSGEELAEFLTTKSLDAGGTVTGSLTVNNNVSGGESDTGASFSTTDAGGILIRSKGGGGGSGGCSTILVYTWCDDGDDGGDAGSVVVDNNGSISVATAEEGAHGIAAISQGGTGGNGGGAFGLFASDAGAGGDGGDGNDIWVTLGVLSDISVTGPGSHGVFARSRGGDGGTGGEPSSLVAIGDQGGNGGDAGDVFIDNAGRISTDGQRSHGIYGLSVGAGAGSGSDASGLVPIGGNGGGESDGARVTINNSGSIETAGADSYGVFAQSIGGGGGDGGSATGLFAIGGQAGSGGNSDVVTVNDSGTISTGGDRSTAIFAQSIGGGGGNGGDAAALSQSLSVAVGGSGGPGGDGDEVHVTADGSDIDTAGVSSHGIHAQSIGGGGGNGGVAAAGSLPSGSPINVSVTLGGTGGSGGDAGEIVEVTTGAETDIATGGASAYGIAAQSIGGGGGNGGSALSAAGGSLSVAVAIGGDGGDGGSSGAVRVDNAGTITTGGDLATGIVAQSLGGGGGNGGFSASLAGGAGSLGVTLGGGGGTGGSSGDVEVYNSNTIATGGDSAVGIFGQSVGGGGGDGGSAVSATAGVMAISAAIGGEGGMGDDSGEVFISNAGDVLTAGAQSFGIFGQSVGGGGGNGGFALSGALAISVENIPAGAAAVAIGGAGGNAGNGDAVTIEIDDGVIETGGLGAHGVLAQSVGGGGGNGGFAGSIGMAVGPGGAFGVSIGGGAGNGGDAGIVTVTSHGESIGTSEDGASGIVAQSIGGGGGDGGFAFSGSAGFGAKASINASVAVGGAGGDGGEGNVIDVDNSADITTQGDHALGIFGQSIGGGGGNGGMAISGTLGFSESAGAVGVAVGGGGGDGNLSRDVDISNSGTIMTSGSEAHGILGQSIGGSGGNGGMALTMQLTGTTKQAATIGVAVGGGGGTGNSAGYVDEETGERVASVVSITNDTGGQIITTGFGAHGILGQSIGGGGGNGGSAVVAQIGASFGTEEQATNSFEAGVTVGGAGGEGGFGGEVSVTNRDTIDVSGDTSIGIMAQSIGGGGGDAGGALNLTGILTDSNNDKSRDVNVNVAVGGGGGDGNDGGVVMVDNSGSIFTGGVSGYGIFAQSVGGGGGIGGRADTVSLTVTNECTNKLLCEQAEADSEEDGNKNFDFDVAVGGSGGGASDGGSVTVSNSGSIETSGATADAIYAQSVGGGGGAGGNGTPGNGELLPTPVEWAAKPFAEKDVTSLSAAVGGDGGSSGDGGDVTIDNAGRLTTHGSNANAIFAQSVGGGGGVGGKGVMGASGTLGLGGAGGAAGDGGNVTIHHTDGAVIETFGSASNGIFAQSVGGGGGIAGNVERGLTSDTSTPIPGLTIPALNIGTGLALGREGGAGGSGGIIDIDIDGHIVTHGDNAAGIFAQSVGGGGGVLGELGNDLPVLSLLSWQMGSAGDAGDAELVDVNIAGNIFTAGNNATGIFAQSAGGDGTAGDVEITVDGSILTGSLFADADAVRGLGSVGIIAQSVAADSADNGNITITIDDSDGVVRGGRSAALGSGSESVGVGVWLLDGAENTITNRGHITTLGGVDAGIAILATGSDTDHAGGTETVMNYGTVTGSVDLGTGANYFANYGVVNSGTRFDVGTGNTLYNAGDLAPGGIMNPLTTSLTGDFTQTDSGTLWYDVDFAGDKADLLRISGTADLEGSLKLNYMNAGKIVPGIHDLVVLTADGGITNYGLGLSAPSSAVVKYSLSAADSKDYALHYKVDFSPLGLNNNQAALGEHVNEIQLAGGTTLMEPLTAALVAIPELADLAAAYDRLSPHVYAENQMSQLYASLGFEQSMHSCPVRDGDMRFSREGECAWFQAATRDIAYEADDGSVGGRDYADTFSIGLQRAMSARWHGGLAFGVEKSDYEIPGAATRNGSRYQLGLIAKGRFGPHLINLSLATSRGEYRTIRDVPVSADEDQAYVYRDLDTAAVHAGYAYSFERGRWFLRPGVDLGWTRVYGDRFDEERGGPAALSVARSEDEYLTSRTSLLVGAEVAGARQILYRPYLQAGWTQFHSGTVNHIEARLAGAPAGVSSFTQSIRTDDNIGGAGLGLDVMIRNGMTLRFAYERQFGDRWDVDGGSVQLIMDF